MIITAPTICVQKHLYDFSPTVGTLANEHQSHNPRPITQRRKTLETHRCDTINTRTLTQNSVEIPDEYWCIHASIKLLCMTLLYCLLFKTFKINKFNCSWKFYNDPEFIRVSSTSVTVLLGIVY